jgi:hypothetical protein
MIVEVLARVELAPPSRDAQQPSKEKSKIETENEGSPVKIAPLLLSEMDIVSKKTS